MLAHSGVVETAGATASLRFTEVPLCRAEDLRFPNPFIRRPHPAPMPAPQYLNWSPGLVVRVQRRPPKAGTASTGVTAG